MSQRKAVALRETPIRCERFRLQVDSSLFRCAPPIIRRFAVTGRFFVACFIAGVAGLSPLSSAQTLAQSSAAYAAPRTSFGAPSIEGTWEANFIFTLEASPDAPSLTLPEREAEALATTRAD